MMQVGIASGLRPDIVISESFFDNSIIDSFSHFPLPNRRKSAIGIRLASHRRE